MWDRTIDRVKFIVESITCWIRNMLLRNSIDTIVSGKASGIQSNVSGVYTYTTLIEVKQQWTFIK